MVDTRLIIACVPTDRAEEAAEILDTHAPDRYWRLDTSKGGLAVYQSIVLASAVEACSDALEAAVGHEHAFSLTVLPVSALLPDRIAEQLEEQHKLSQPEPELSSEGKTPLRISRAELRTTIGKGVTVDRAFVASASIASLVAAIGLVRGDAAIIVGAMVIAPLLGPHMALALATTLGDFDLARKSLRASLVGGLLTIGVAVLYAIVHAGPFEPSDEFIGRTTVGFSSVALALASGVAGAFAFTSGLSASLVGVMVAVALVPPVVTSCFYAVHGQWGGALGAALLFATNLVCVNLAGVITFTLQGYSPRRWWEQSRARKGVRRSLMLWTGMLVAILAVIALSTLRATPNAPVQPSPEDASEASP
ncbi:MAG: TIGR00341 family protein [Phycisphaerales bacterium]